jgi:hypothetical protein
MKKIIFILVPWLYIFSLVAQPAGVFPRILSRPQTANMYEVKVKDLYTSDCGYEKNCNYLYPVLVEDFDYNLDLQNKWDFGNNHGTDNTNWYGDGYYYGTDTSVPYPYTGPITNHNIKLNSGIATFVTIPENITRSGQPYKFTSGYLKSLYKFRTGVFEARIKVPSLNKMWPAYWLIYSNSNYSEVDIFEFYDHNVSSTSICDVYNLQTMTIHGGPLYTPDVHRSDKFPLFLNDAFHDYKLVWNEYEVLIFVDGIFRGYATKYFKHFTPPFFPCVYGSPHNSLDPLLNLSCAQIQAMPDNLLPTLPYIDFGPRPWWLPGFVPWPPPQPPQPYLANKVDKDFYFPEKDNAMKLIVSSGVNPTYKNDGFSGLDKQMDMQIDWIKVYQPFCCGVDKTVCSLTDLDNQTYKTMILTGRNLTIGNISNTCNFAEEDPTYDPKKERPIVLLATDMIAIHAEAIFLPDIYAEMRITDCGSLARINNSESEQVEAFFQKQQTVLDSLTQAESQYINPDSLAKVEYESTMQKYKDMYYTVDAESISVGPNPTDGYLEIICSNTLFARIVNLSLIDVNGKEYPMPLQQHMNISNVASGFYQLKFKFDDGTTTIKKVVRS